MHLYCVMIAFFNLSQRFVPHGLLRIFFNILLGIFMQIFTCYNFGIFFRLLFIGNVAVLYYIFRKNIRFGSFISQFRALIFILSHRRNFAGWHKGGFKIELSRFDIDLTHLQIFIIQIVLNILACQYLFRILSTFDLFTRFQFGLGFVLPFVNFLNQIYQPLQSFFNKFSLLKKLFNCYLRVNIKHLSTYRKASLYKFMIWQCFYIRTELQNRFVQFWTILSIDEVQYLKIEQNGLVFYVSLLQEVLANFEMRKNTHVFIQLCESTQ